MSPSTELVPLRPQRPRRRRGRWAAAWRRLARFSRSQPTRRAALAVLLAGAAAGLVGLSYATADADPARSRPRPAAVAAPAAEPGGAAAERAASPRTGTGAAARRRPSRPETVAVDWYAKRLSLPTGRVRALGSQRLGPGRLRVLVLADDHSRRPTAWIPLRHSHGGWTVAR
jgi:hypothetical protein